MTPDPLDTCPKHAFDVLHDELKAAKRRLVAYCQQKLPPGSRRWVYVSDPRYHGFGWRTYTDFDQCTASVLLSHGEVRSYSIRNVSISDAPISAIPKRLRRVVLQRYLRQSIST